MQTEVWQQRNFEEYKPNFELNKLEQMMGKNKTIQLQHYVEYCYYTILEVSSQIYNSPPTLSTSIVDRIKSMNKQFVKAHHMPCLIYEHLSETFYSLVEAYFDNDLELIKVEIQEIKETISSFMPDREYRYYQSFNHLQIDENFADCFLKDRFVKDIEMLIEQCQKAPTNNKKAKKSKFKAKDVENIVKEKLTQLKKRHEERVKPLLGKLLSRRKAKEQNSKQVQDKQFLLNYGINKYKNLI